MNSRSIWKNSRSVQKNSRRFTKIKEDTRKFQNVFDGSVFKTQDLSDSFHRIIILKFNDLKLKRSYQNSIMETRKNL